MASKLEIGAQCPVCGSKEHPSLAVLTDDAPSEVELNESKTKYEKKQIEVMDLSTKAGNLKGQFESKRTSIEKLIPELLGKCNFSECRSKIKDTLSEISIEIEDLKKRIAVEEINIKNKSRLEKEIPKKEKEINEKESSKKGLEEAIIVLETNVYNLQKNVDDISVNLEFLNKEEAIKNVSIMEKNRIIIQKSIEDSQKLFRTCELEINRLDGTIKSLNDQLKDTVVIDKDIVIGKQMNLLEEKNQLTEIITEISTRISTNRSALENINIKADTLYHIETRLTWVKSLANTANGNLSGKEKIMLETYIQMSYFDRIISRANSRFMVMSSGQYELKRRIEANNNRSQSGLELDVIDHYNASERDVKTLSGGESFQASLSLALGLSDEIQSSAGGIKLDTMFVDEGFGSLDEDALQQAIKLLNTLSEGNRLVGIISHVNELKEKIEKQIIIRKEKSGGSNVEIVY